MARATVTLGSGTSRTWFGTTSCGLLEPELRQAVQHLALEGDGGEHAVERAQPVGGDEEQPVALAVDVADLAPVALAQGVEVGLGQGVVELLGEDRVRQGRDASARVGGAAAR